VIDSLVHHALPLSGTSTGCAYCPFQQVHELLGDG
jgi:hypothetical protein